MIVRTPAVAGLFYPDEPDRLRQTVTALLDAAPVETLLGPPAAYVVPHAGHVYSGSTAALAYQRMRLDPPSQVLLLGPAHRVRLRGLALSPADLFQSPLGEIRVDDELRERVSGLPQVSTSVEAHAQEHSLEVQLPFLSVVAPEATVLPLVVGSATAAEVADVIETALGDDPSDTLLLISTDLSHYHPYAEAKAIDQATIDMIGRREQVQHDRACGATPLNGAIEVACRRDWDVSLLGACSSGDTAGDRDRVVGYATFWMGDGRA